MPSTQTSAQFLNFLIKWAELEAGLKHTLPGSLARIRFFLNQIEGLKPDWLI